MSDFAPFALAVHRRFNELAKLGELFVVNVEKDDLWLGYLSAFPAGTNPIFRTNTEHDCSCCRGFVKNIGGVVAFDAQGKLLTVWDDIGSLPAPYNTVSKRMAAYVMAKHAVGGITGVFRSAEPSYGAEHTKELHEGGKVHRWNHFHTGQLTPYFYKGKGAAEARGKYHTNQQTLMRALTELTPEAVEEVLSLIDSNSLYRGEEKRDIVANFQKVQTKYRAIKDMAQRDIFTWQNANDKAAFFRNDVIGTLCVNLSDGADLEDAVKSFESKVAPTNYRRTSSLITPRMVEDAVKTIHDLGYQPSLKRRLARLNDVSVNNVLWVNNDARKTMKDPDGIAGLLAGSIKAPKVLASKNAANTTMDSFLLTIMPRASAIELLVENKLASNFVALTTADDKDTPTPFAWDNNFAWTYDGNVTDSIRERVKKAGGNVDAPLRFSLSWFNADDLDLHVYTPQGEHICFASPTLDLRSGRVLDVDTNGGGPQNHIDPVENLSFQDSYIRDGIYHVWVHQYRKAASANPGFDFEIFTGGQSRFFSYKDSLRQGDRVDIGKFRVERGVITGWQLNKALIEGAGAVQEKWGVTTQNYVPVRTILHSPNHWDGNSIGNKHWVFALLDCAPDVPVRGFYNEFLHPELNKHRKVFEILADKMKCPPDTDALAGLGFSSTKPETITLRVTFDKEVRTFNVTI